MSQPPTVSPDKKAPSAKRDEDGNFILDAEFIASRFGLQESAVRDLMRRNLVHSLVEEGRDTDANTWRLTLRCGNRQWRAILGIDGELHDETIRFVSPQSR